MMTKKRKVCVVITARSSYSRIRSALFAIRRSRGLRLQLVIAASALLDRYGPLTDVIRKDGFKPDATVYMVLEGENLVTTAKSTGLGIVELATILNNLKPDIAVSIADRYETIAAAVAASYLNIPLVHIQGGEITGSIDEKVRHAVTKLADFHFVSHRAAREFVIRMGEDPKSVFVTGCPSIDLARDILKNPALNFNPFKKYAGVGEAFDYRKGYLVAIQHPVTTEYDEAEGQIVETLCAVESMNIPTFWFWPNADAGSDGTAKGIRVFRENRKPALIHFFKNMVPEDFLRLVYNALCVVGNSSVAVRECSFLGVPAVNIGTRQDGRRRGRNVVDAGYKRKDIVKAIRRQLGNARCPQARIYGDGNAGRRIASLLARIPLNI